MKLSFRKYDFQGSAEVLKKYKKKYHIKIEIQVCMCVCVCFFWQSLFLLCRFWKEWPSLAHPTGGKSCYVCMNVNESETCHDRERCAL